MTVLGEEWMAWIIPSAVGVSGVRFFGLNKDDNGVAYNTNGSSLESETVSHNNHHQTSTASTKSNAIADDGLPLFLRKMAEKVGKISEPRMISDVEYSNDTMTKLYSNLRCYETASQQKQKTNGGVGKNNKTLEAAAIAVEARSANSRLYCPRHYYAAWLRAPSC